MQARFWSGQRTRHIHLPRIWRRHPWVAAVIALLVVLALVDHRGDAGWLGDDRTRYHNQVFVCTKVFDGDTIEINVPDGRYPRTRIRMWGVDTPEVSSNRTAEMFYGPEASAYAKRRLLKRPVRIELASNRTRGKFGRVLAYVYEVETGVLFNAKLIETGHGYADTRFDHPLKQRFDALEEAARLAKRGLWKEVLPTQMPRWKRKEVLSAED